jgi:hypothetical protein
MPETLHVKIYFFQKRMLAAKEAEVRCCFIRFNKGSPFYIVTVGNSPVVL